MTRAETLRFIERLEANCEKRIDKEGKTVYMMNGRDFVTVDYNTGKKKES